MTNLELQLLLGCTCFESSPPFWDKLRTAAAKISIWENLPAMSHQCGNRPTTVFYETARLARFARAFKISYSYFS
jgi:hypothetical protein